MKFEVHYLWMQPGELCRPPVVRLCDVTRDCGLQDFVTMIRRDGLVTENSWISPTAILFVDAKEMKGNKTK